MQASWVMANGDPEGQIFFYLTLTLILSPLKSAFLFKNKLQEVWKYNADPHDGFFYPNLTQIMDSFSYITEFRILSSYKLP